METLPIIKVSVRDLVEFVLQQGDLRTSFVGGVRAQAGIRGHQKIQKSRPAGYEAEVAVSFVHTTAELSLEIGGRIDGVWRTTDPIVIDEIKTTARALETFSIDDHPLHWGQAKAYAALICRKHDLERIGIQLTYLQIDSGEVLEFRRDFTRADLEIFFTDLVTRYCDWARTLLEWRRLRDGSIDRLGFPFSNYRAGQREFAVAVYRAIAGGKKLFAQAPTGIGKTIATVFPALKALGEGKVAKIFYLTAKTVGRGVAEQALAKLAANGLRCKVLTLTAKEKICFLDKPDCRPEVCEFAQGYFDRVLPALQEMFAADRFDRKAIEDCARAHRICPFEFSLFLSLWSDLIIGDVNYAFDPRVYLRRFFGSPDDPAPREPYAFLVDEAHNLPDRARDMFSADLSRDEFIDLKKQIKSAYPSIVRAVSKITPFFSRAQKQIAGKLPPDPSMTTPPTSAATTPALISRQAPEDFIRALWKFHAAAEAVLAAAEPSAARESLLTCFFRVTAFLRVAETFDEQFVCLYERSSITLYCLDPSTLLKEAQKRAVSCVFFSATLLPLDYFLRMLGGEPGDGRIRLPSPFPPEHLGVLLLPHIRTEYRFRDREFASIAEVIDVTVASRGGNYLVYFPSYRFLTAVKDEFTARAPGCRIIEQRPGMTEEERDAFLQTFSADNREPLVGFAVMGGIFGEGIDLRGERLVGSIIVGVGLPQICLERDLIREFFERVCGAGFAFAYRFPGINRVLQAAGRVIRTEEDRGVVLLIDERFAQPEYRNLLPREWQPIHPARSIEACRSALETFWKKLP